MCRQHMQCLSYLLEVSPGSIFCCHEKKWHKQTFVQKVTSSFLLSIFVTQIFACCYIKCGPCEKSSRGWCVAYRYWAYMYPGVYTPHQQQPACLRLYSHTLQKGEADSYFIRILYLHHIFLSCLMPNADRHNSRHHHHFNEVTLSRNLIFKNWK